MDGIIAFFLPTTAARRRHPFHLFCNYRRINKILLCASGGWSFCFPLRLHVCSRSLRRFFFGSIFRRTQTTVEQIGADSFNEGKNLPLIHFCGRTDIKNFAVNLRALRIREESNCRFGRTQKASSGKILLLN